MGTRGAYGFRLDETDYVTYNHFDSYPDDLGREIAEAITSYLDSGKTLEQMADKVQGLKLIQDEDQEPTAEELAAFAAYRDEKVSTGKNWYSLLRDMQGNILEHLEAGVMIDSHGFLMDSLFCEWAYIVNLDTGMLEVYTGFTTERVEDGGRYNFPNPNDPESEYIGVALIAEHPLTDLPSDFANQINRLAYPEEFEDEDAA